MPFLVGAPRLRFFIIGLVITCLEATSETGIRPPIPRFFNGLSLPLPDASEDRKSRSNALYLLIAGHSPTWENTSTPQMVEILLSTWGESAVVRNAFSTQLADYARELSEEIFKEPTGETPHRPEDKAKALSNLLTIAEILDRPTTLRPLFSALLEQALRAQQAPSKFHWIVSEGFLKPENFERLASVAERTDPAFAERNPEFIHWLWTAAGSQSIDRKKLALVSRNITDARLARSFLERTLPGLINERELEGRTILRQITGAGNWFSRAISNTRDRDEREGIARYLYGQLDRYSDEIESELILHIFNNDPKLSLLRYLTQLRALTPESDDIYPKFQDGLKYRQKKRTNGRTKDTRDPLLLFFASFGLPVGLEATSRNVATAERLYLLAQGFGLPGGSDDRDYGSHSFRESIPREIDKNPAPAKVTTQLAQMIANNADELLDLFLDHPIHETRFHPHSLGRKHNALYNFTAATYHLHRPGILRPFYEKLFQRLTGILDGTSREHWVHLEHSPEFIWIDISRTSTLHMLAHTFVRFLPEKTLNEGEKLMEWLWTSGGTQPFDKLEWEDANRRRLDENAGREFLARHLPRLLEEEKLDGRFVLNELRKASPRLVEDLSRYQSQQRQRVARYLDLILGKYSNQILDTLDEGSMRDLDRFKSYWELLIFLDKTLKNPPKIRPLKLTGVAYELRMAARKLATLPPAKQTRVLRTFPQFESDGIRPFLESFGLRTDIHATATNENTAKQLYDLATGIGFPVEYHWYHKDPHFADLVQEGLAANASTAKVKTLLAQMLTNNADRILRLIFDFPIDTGDSEVSDSSNHSRAAKEKALNHLIHIAYRLHRPKILRPFYEQLYHRLEKIFEDTTVEHWFKGPESGQNTFDLLALGIEDSVPDLIRTQTEFTRWLSGKTIRPEWETRREETRAGVEFLISSFPEIWDNENSVDGRYILEQVGKSGAKLIKAIQETPDREDVAKEILRLVKKHKEEIEYTLEHTPRNKYGLFDSYRQLLAALEEPLRQSRAEEDLRTLIRSADGLPLPQCNTILNFLGVRLPAPIRS